MTTPNDFPALSDNDMIDAAIHAGQGGTVVIPPRRSKREPERTWWLLDRAILLPENTTLVLDNCRIKLSDQARDNFIRSANCGMGTGDPAPLENIHIKGIGSCILEGADHPRSTGDGSKLLACPCPKRIPGQNGTTWEDAHASSYGTDAAVPGESHYGDWRNIGILMANVSHFSIENIRLVEPHAWGISLEACSFGNISRIDFSAQMKRTIDGIDQNIENQDGIDLRNGCHDIIVSDITGSTGDDTVALTAIAQSDPPCPGGCVNTTHVMHNDFTRRDKGIHNVIIRNIFACPAGGQFHLRLLATCGATIRNVLVDGLVDSSPDDFHVWGSILIGEGGDGYGPAADDAISDVSISNVITNAQAGIIVCHPVKNLRYNNILNRFKTGNDVIFN